MLKKLRHKKTAKLIWLTLAVLIIPAFVFWGFGSFLRSKEETGSLGKIFGRKISEFEFKDALDAVRIQAYMQFGENFSQLQKYLNLESQAIDRLILLYEAKKRKISASDKEVVDLIQSYPFFQRKGKFDNAIYTEILKYAFRTQPRAYENQARQNIILSKLYKQLTENIKVSEDEAKEEYKKLNTEISVYYLAAVPLGLAKSISPSEEEIKDYFAKNAIQFKQPRSINLEYVASESGADLEKLSRLLRRKRKADWQGLVKEKGLLIKETGLFNESDSIPGIGWSPQVSGIITKLNAGKFSPVIYSEKYYLFRVKEVTEAYIPEYEKIKDKVREKFIEVKANQEAGEKMQACLGKIKELYKVNPKSVNFEKIAQEFGLKSDSTKPFKYNSYIEGIGGSDSFWLEAQRLKDDQASGIISTPAGLFIIRPKSRSEIEEKKFQEEKGPFSEKLLTQKKQEFFIKFTEELRKKSNLS